MGRGLGKLAWELGARVSEIIRSALDRDGHAEAAVLIELIEDDNDTWVFEVPSLNIIGGAATREAAIERAREAIAFTLEARDESEPPTDGSYVLEAKIRLAGGRSGPVRSTS